MVVVGSPAQVWHGTADQTPGGITRAGLIQDKNGQIKYLAQRRAQLERAKREKKEGRLPFGEVWGGKKGAPFKPAPKAGTPEHKKLMKKMKPPKKMKPKENKNKK